MMHQAKKRETLSANTAQLAAKAALSHQHTHDKTSQNQSIITHVPHLQINSATRFNEEEFWLQSALGLSLKKISAQLPHKLNLSMRFNIAFSNKLGLASVFNQQIKATSDDAILVFMHDDVWIDDTDFISNIVAGLAQFDVIGVAGNRCRLPNQPAWAYIDHTLALDEQSNLSGRIAHGQFPDGTVTEYGTSSTECVLLDGVFLATTKQCLSQYDVQFDTQFNFHFYDLDFCRTATQRGLRLGTWPIKLTHQSTGSYGCTAWREAYQHYLNKWEPAITDAELLNYLQQTQQNKQDLSSAIAEVLALAASHEQANDFTLASTLYKEVLAVDAGNARANHQLGLLKAKFSNLNDALSHLEIAIQQQPECEEFWTGYIKTLMRFWAVEESEAALELSQQFGLSAATTKRLAHIEELNIPLIQSTTPAQSIEVKQLLVSMVERIQLINQANNSGFLNINEFEPAIDALLKSGAIDEVLGLIHQTIKFTKLHKNLVGHTVYTPYFDQLLANIELDIDPIRPSLGNICNMVMTSELYVDGGHTQVVIDLLAHLENPVLVMTDVYNRGILLDSIKKLLASKLPSHQINCPIYIIKPNSFLNKTKEVAQLINTHAKNVFLLNHHDDVIAVTACQRNFNSQFYYVHHADHHLALGNTVTHFQHVDLFKSRAELCAHSLKIPTHTLPITASDVGAKAFSYPIKQFATVTAGSFGKFESTDYIAQLILACLKVTNGIHHHFGDIAATHLTQIKNILLAYGAAESAFIYHGNVPSLAQALHDTEAHIYIGSAPIGGGRGDIEAQSVGYPLLSFKDNNGGIFINIGSHHADAVYWSNLAEMQAGLHRIITHHRQFSENAREFYLANCAAPLFSSKLHSLCKPH